MEPTWWGNVRHFVLLRLNRLLIALKLKTYRFNRGDVWRWSR